MNIYFIDTLELTYSSDFDDIIKLTKNFKMVNPKKGAVILSISLDTFSTQNAK